MSTYLLVLQGGLAGGSAVWGALAQTIGNPEALVVAGIGLALTLPAALRWRVGREYDLDLTPLPQREEPRLIDEPALGMGPVMILVEYRIDPERAQEFVDAARALGRIRRRDGASSWGIFRDSTDPSRYLETFLVESWDEYLRQRERITVADVGVQERVRDIHAGEEPPRVFRFIDPGARRSRLTGRRRTTPLV
jgi:hypothetical protein